MSETSEAAHLVRASRRPKGSRRSTSAAKWYFLLPSAALFIFVIIVPSVQGSLFAFTDWNGISVVKEWIGAANFVAILSDPAAMGALLHTLFFAAVITIGQNVIGLLLAVAVHAKIRSRNVLRVVFFAPAVIAPVAVAFLWQYLLAPDGAVNESLRAIGLGNLAQNWLGDPGWALISVAVVVIWQFSGYSMVIFIAGLEGVPNEVLEASMVDGAGPVRRFWSIVLPYLRPAITINVMLSLIGGLKLFDQVWVLTNGGPGTATETLSTMLVGSAFKYSEYGYSTALALVLTVLVAVLASVQYLVLERKSKEARS